MAIFDRLIFDSGIYDIEVREGIFDDAIFDYYIFDTEIFDPSGTATLTFSVSGLLAQLNGVSNLIFSPTATIKAIGILKGSSDLTFSPSAKILGIFNLSGSQNIVFNNTGEIYTTSPVPPDGTIYRLSSGTSSDYIYRTS